MMNNRLKLFTSVGLCVCLKKKKTNIARNPNKRACIAKNITFPYEKETDDLLRRLKVEKETEKTLR